MRLNIFLVAFGCLVIIGLTLLIRSPYWIAMTKSQDQFIQSKTNERMFFEPGAEEISNQIEAFLPEAIKMIEQKYGLPFKDSFKVMVCATQKSLNEYIAGSSPYPIRGAVLGGNVYISPSAFSFSGIDTHKESLLHELSHLHLRQRLGFFKERKIPVWFREGLADVFSGSGGEGVNEHEVMEYLLAGKTFIPLNKSGIFNSFDQSRNGLSGPMFHKQAKMFVEYIISTDPKKFNSFLLALQQGEDFEKAFYQVLNSQVDQKWQQFLAGLN